MLIVDKCKEEHPSGRNQCPLTGKLLEKEGRCECGGFVEFVPSRSPRLTDFYEHSDVSCRSLGHLEKRIADAKFRALSSVLRKSYNVLARKGEIVRSGEWIEEEVMVEIRDGGTPVENSPFLVARVRRQQLKVRIELRQRAVPGYMTEGDYGQKSHWVPGSPAVDESKEKEVDNLEIVSLDPAMSLKLEQQRWYEFLGSDFWKFQEVIEKLSS